MKLVTLNIDGWDIEFRNQCRKTRNGFAHDTTLFIKGQEWKKATCHYCNRTWERYVYQTVMREAVYEAIKDLKELIKKGFKEGNGYVKLTPARARELEIIYELNEVIQLYNKILIALA